MSSHPSLILLLELKIPAMKDGHLLSLLHLHIQIKPVSFVLSARLASSAYCHVQGVLSTFSFNPPFPTPVQASGVASQIQPGCRTVPLFSSTFHKADSPLPHWFLQPNQPFATPQHTMGCLLSLPVLCPPSSMTFLALYHITIPAIPWHWTQPLLLLLSPCPSPAPGW